MADVPIGNCTHLADEEGCVAGERLSRSGVRAMRQERLLTLSFRGVRVSAMFQCW